MFDFQQGIEDGKKSQSKRWIISGLIGLFGILFIYLYKIPKDFKFSKEYTEGYIKGVKLRRLKYWTFGLLSIIVVNTISEISQPTQKQSENNKINSSLLTKPKSITTVKKTKLLSLMDCVEIMENHCKGSNQQLIKYFESEFDGKIIYMFFTLSYSTPGYSCVSLMTPLGEDILSVDCKTNEVKVMEWNNIPGSPKIYL